MLSRSLPATLAVLPVCSSAIRNPDCVPRSNTYFGTFPDAPVETGRETRLRKRQSDELSVRIVRCRSEAPVVLENGVKVVAVLGAQPALLALAIEVLERGDDLLGAAQRHVV